MIEGRDRQPLTWSDDHGNQQSHSTDTQQEKNHETPCLCIENEQPWRFFLTCPVTNIRLYHLLVNEKNNQYETNSSL